MALQRQSEGAVVGERFLALARRGQRHAGFVATRRAQHLGRPGVDSRHRPRRLVAMAGERLQRPRFGEHRQGMGVEEGAPRQVFDADEGRLGARRDDAPAGLFGEPLDAVEAEPHRLRGAALAERAGRRARCALPSPAIVLSQSLTATSTGSTSTPCSRASRTSCAGA